MDSTKFVDTVEKAYRQGRREGFRDGQQKGSETVIVGWADERNKLCKHVEELCSKVLTARAERDAAQASLNKIETRLKSATTYLRIAIAACVVLLVWVVALAVSR